MTRLPGAIFIVDTMREHIAVKEAQKLNIPIFAMVDTNSDPRPIDYVIPSNDDASKSIAIIMSEVTRAIAEGLSENENPKRQPTRKATSQTRKLQRKAKQKRRPKKDCRERRSKTSLKQRKRKWLEKPKTETIVIKEVAAASGYTDDLTKIEGIGPKAAEALLNAGLNTFAILSKSDPGTIKEIFTEASSRMAHLDPGSWPKQVTNGCRWQMG